MCSFAVNEGASDPRSSSLEEAVLFLDIAEYVMPVDVRLLSFAWTILCKVLLPSARTLKAVMLLMAPAQSYHSVGFPSAPCFCIVCMLEENLVGSATNSRSICGHDCDHPYMP